MSSQLYAQVSKVIQKLFAAAVFNDGFTKSKSEQKEIDDANSVLCKIIFYLGNTKHICNSEVDKLFSNFYKAFKKTRKYEQVLELNDIVFYIQTCMNQGDIKALKDIDYDGIEFACDSDCESDYSESECDSECESDMSDDDMSDDESDMSDDESDMSDDEEEEKNCLSDNSLTQVNRYINQLLKAKIFKEEFDYIVEGSDDVLVIDLLDEVRDMLNKAVGTLSKYLNGVTSDISYVKHLLSSALDDLEACAESVGKKHVDQVELLQDRVHWILLMLDMDDNEIEDEFACYDVKGLKMSR